MRELNFSEENVAEAFEEIQEHFEVDVERRIEDETADFLNGMLKLESSIQLGAGLYKRTLSRLDYCAGYRPRTLVTTNGTYELRVPKARLTPLRFAQFGRCQRLWNRVHRYREIMSVTSTKNDNMTRSPIPVPWPMPSWTALSITLTV